MTTDYYDRDLKPMEDYSNKKTQWGGRRVLQTIVGDYRVSTVWLGLDHRYGNGAPIVSESMIWDGQGDGKELDSERHYSEEEAARWHLRALDAIRAGSTPDYANEDWVNHPMTTPNTDLTEQIARAIHDGHDQPQEWADAPKNVRRDYLADADVVLPLVEAAVKRGQAEALRDAAYEFDQNVGVTPTGHDGIDETHQGDLVLFLEGRADDHERTETDE